MSYAPELVRDKIPYLLKLKGLNPDYKLLDTKDHNRYDFIAKKMSIVSGEAINSLKSGDPEKVLTALSNVMEIVGVAADQYGFSMGQIKQERDKKRHLKGSFANFTVLISPNRLPY